MLYYCPFRVENCRHTGGKMARNNGYDPDENVPEEKKDITGLTYSQKQDLLKNARHLNTIFVYKKEGGETVIDIVKTKTERERFISQKELKTWDNITKTGIKVKHYARDYEIANNKQGIPEFRLIKTHKTASP